MMPPIRAKWEGKKVIIACLHWRNFPPGLALSQKPPEELWGKGELKELDFQQYQVWKRVCQRVEMDPEECLACEMVRLLSTRNHLPVMISLDGSSVIPTTDIPTLETAHRYRGNLVIGIRPGRQEKDE
jgi:hypothetical protein